MFYEDRGLVMSHSKNISIEEAREKMRKAKAKIGDRIKKSRIY